MTTLITGGTGKTGIRLARLIHAAGHPVLLTSRKGVAPDPFKVADGNIDKVYLVAPVVLDILPVVKPFIELAISKGVKKFVLLSASQMDKGSIYVGKIHEYLVERGVENTVLQNFGGFYLSSIRENNEIFSVTRDGPIPLIGADDIAKAAYDALFATNSANTDYFLIGPELFSYTEACSDLSLEFKQRMRLSQAAALLSETLGRKISHRHLTNDEEIAIFHQSGIPQERAAGLNHGESLIAEGAEEALVRHVKAITGVDKLKDHLEANKHLWIKE
ncbi:hypothetical protein NLJ89_g4861 [Agrocybe chaxingu]|uniref:NmrA-like domain-containing protein n=1 Tax=Agrocybe chaxingu TaxID=84603 RepID=A0A9W8JZM1_9AGAR|nr:hypothetical protein NLJ89_g4861 [Agrocybe chaxingu]